MAANRLIRKLEPYMSVELQGLVDRLGHILQRSVAVDDPKLKIIVYGKHYGDEDPVRMQALVGRGAVEHMREYLAGHRIATWQEPRYMDADESLGLKRRLVIPLRSGRTLLGFVWIIVGDDLEPGELETSLDVSTEITSILARQADRQVEDELRISGLVLDLLSGGQAARRHAGLLLGEERAFAAARNFTVLLVQCVDSALPGHECRGIRGREAVRKTLSTRYWGAYALATPKEGTAVLLGTRAPLAAGEAADLCRGIQRELKAEGESDLVGAVVSAGATVGAMDEACFSFEQATVAARAASVADLGTVAWEGLGLAALLPALLEQSVERHLVPEAFQSMMAGQSAEMLRLVEAYLEAAGNAADTAERLHLHRSSVYYNLGQFQKATGLDLGDGNTRFHMHLWLKIRKYSDRGNRNRAD